MRKLRTSLAQRLFHRLRHVVFQRALLLSAYRPASIPGASPVQAKRVVRRLLVPGLHFAIPNKFFAIQAGFANFKVCIIYIDVIALADTFYIQPHSCKSRILP